MTEMHETAVREVQLSHASLLYRYAIRGRCVALGENENNKKQRVAILQREYRKIR